MPHNEQGIAQGFAEPPFEGVAVGLEPPMVEGAPGIVILSQTARKWAAGT